ncbi:hypothetical protein L484_003763 [Morus notabilis]|uniref:Uncharacterized protein n=1 Tax=Morus notabilis TaxID=981085 RepID=W9SCB3_9ROSA|nr:hypothetical protein L484_003763 [Morus notabilis]
MCHESMATVLDQSKDEDCSCMDNRSTIWTPKIESAWQRDWSQDGIWRKISGCRDCRASGTAELPCSATPLVAEYRQCLLGGHSRIDAQHKPPSGHARTPSRSTFESLLGTGTPSLPGQEIITKRRFNSSRTRGRNHFAIKEKELELCRAVIVLRLVLVVREATNQDRYPKSPELTPSNEAGKLLDILSADRQTAPNHEFMDMVEDVPQRRMSLDQRPYCSDPHLRPPL